MTAFASRFAGALKVRRAEVPALLWSAGYYFCLLSGYYVLRPVRDEMGIQGGVGNLQWLFSATFVLMLAAVPVFGWAVRRWPRAVLVPRVYYFFIVNLLVFVVLFEAQVAPAWVARAFFVWLSVFNLFVVSVFWSLMADLFSNAQARRLFGVIAAGGSAGAIVGPALSAVLAARVGPASLVAISIGFLLVATVCVGALTRHHRHADTGHNSAPAIGGSVLAGARLVLRSPYLLGICAFIVLYTTLATFLYFQQAYIIEQASADSGYRTALFASIDLAVNVLTVLAQLFVTARLVERYGVAVTLALVPVVLVIGFVALAVVPVLAALVAVQVIRRAGNYAITRPAREVLFTVVSREEKYKAKNLIDTVVYRGGDAASGWLFAALSGLGLSLSAIAWIAAPLAAVWAVIGVSLGRRQEMLKATAPDNVVAQIP